MTHARTVRTDTGETTKEFVRRKNREIREKKRRKRKETILPKTTIKKPIKAEKKKTGIAAFREKDTLAGKAVKVLTSPKTTVALAATAALLATRNPQAAAAVSRAGTAVITRTAIGKVSSLTTQRAFAGRSASSGIDKVFHTVRPIARRFTVNAKSQGLTKSLLSKTGLSLGAASLLVGAIGSYPFAGFIKEEAIQTLGFAFNTAERNKDIEGMENAIEEVDEIINNANTIMDKVPYANVLKQLRVFFEAATVKLDNDRRRLETLRGELEEGETAFQRERRETDEAAFERKREFGEEESKRFEGIREENEARSQELQKERDTRKTEELEFESKFFRLIREKRFDEADALQAEFIKKLKGGE